MTLPELTVFMSVSYLNFLSVLFFFHLCYPCPAEVGVSSLQFIFCGFRSGRELCLISFEAL